MFASTNPIRPVLIGRVWYVTDETTNVIHGPFDSSWSAIEKTKELRGGKTAEAAKTAKKNGLRYER